MLYLRMLAILVFTSCTTVKEVEQTTLQITEVVPDRRTHLTTQNLVHLTKIYDTQKFTYQKSIKVKSGVPATHYPVITLNTRFAENPHKILSAFMHEQFHWWLILNSQKARVAIQKLKVLYPQLKDHQHLIVCSLEYRAMVQFVGQQTAFSIIQDLIFKDKIFPWYHNQVLQNGEGIRKVIKEAGLMPPGLN